MKKKTHMKMKKRYIIILFCLLGLFESALSQKAPNYLVNYTSTGTQTIELIPTTGNNFKVKVDGALQPTEYGSLGPVTVSGGGTLKIIFSTTAPVIVYKATDYAYGFQVLKGTLEMSLGSGYSASATLMRSDTFLCDLFIVRQNTEVSTCELKIDGNATHHFIIDGRADMTIEGTKETSYTATNSGLTSTGRLFFISGANAAGSNPAYYGGTVVLNYVDLVNNWNGSSSSGSAFCLMPSSVKSKINLTMKHCIIDHCYSWNSGAAMFISGVRNTPDEKRSTVLMEDCITRNCFTYSEGLSNSSTGGTYRTGNGANFDITMRRCDILDNISNNFGGGITFNMGTSIPLKLESCTIDGNWGQTGGLHCAAAATITGCTITNNYAWGNGGGIHNKPYEGGPGDFGTYNPYNETLELDANTVISGNEARENGGGIYVDVTPTNFRIGATSGALEWTCYFNSENTQFGMNVEINGATISNNTATNGGGIYLHRDADIYQTNIHLNWGTIENNTATQNGGACYVFSDITTKNYSDFWYGATGTPQVAITAAQLAGFDRDMSVTIGSSASSGTLVMQGNSAANGGCVYATANHNSSVTTSKLIVTFNENCNIGSTSHPNIASNGNGGALYIDKGEVNILGGNVNYNTATSNGAGIYTTTNTTIKVGAGDFEVQHNTVNGVPNNLYLPTNKTIEVVSGSFDPKYLGIYTQATATAASPIPVFTVSNASNYGYLNNIYNGMRNGTMNVIDDQQIHSAQYTSPETILYFGIGSPWSPYQQTVKKSTDLVDSNGDGVYEIGNVKQLTAFLWYANGITTHDASFTPAVPGAKGILTADINMENHYWEPFADYSGIFDGNGHVITGITMVPSNASSGRGLFGTTAAGADIKNVTLDDCQFFAPSSGACYVGSIVSDLAAGTVRNSVANPGTQLFASGNASAILGGLAGKVSGGTLHSSIAMTEMTGYTMGGLVGEITSGNLFNSFANPKFTNSGSGYMGGLVAVNNGTVENCYVRLQGSAPASNFGWLVGQSNNANIKYCYIPNGASPYKATGTEPSGHGSYGTTSVPYLYNHRDNQITLVSGTSPYVSNVSGADKQMLIALNKWVTTENTKDTPRAVCTYWLRPTTKTINDDLPILRLPATNAVAATDGEAYLDYNQVNELLTGYTTATQAICLYGQEGSMNSNSGSAASLYIDQEATLVPVTPGTVINGYTSQMINKYESSRWHNFSSPLRQSDIGFTYHNTIPAPFGWTEINPCSVTIASDDAHSLFPSDLLSKTTFASVDLYCFYEPEYHWLNLKRNTDSHWHMNATTEPISYVGNGIGASTNGNETYLVPGKGYLVSIDVDQLLQNYGTLNNGDVTLYSVTKSDNNAWAGRLGFNLLGNPYQSYLNFEEFKSQNASNLWAGGSAYDNTYATFDPQLNSYVQYKAGTSYGAFTASQYIHPHQGFFIRMTKGTNSSTTVKYTNDMRSLRGNDKSNFRGGEQPAYPLINFVVNDSEGNADIAVLELGRTEDDGAMKMRMNECKGMISLGYGNDDFGILFRTEVEDYQSLRFEAAEEGTFTLTWNTANAEFDKLTLIDNIAGTTTDMLGRDSYSFEATPDQYASRFKVVIGDYKGIDEPEVPEPVEGPSCNFAFQMGDQLVVNGEGNLQIIDILGHVVMTDQLIGNQSTTSLPTTAGVYVLRLTDTNGTRTQKMVIR